MEQKRGEVTIECKTSTTETNFGGVGLRLIDIESPLIRRDITWNLTLGSARAKARERKDIEAEITLHRFGGADVGVLRMIGVHR